MITQNYVDGLNKILSDYSFGMTVSINDLRLVQSGAVCRAVIENQNRPLLATRLWNKVSPTVHEGEFFHFTSEEAARSILSKPLSLWLAGILKRLDEHEIISFLEKFGFSYPLEPDPVSGEDRFHTTIAQNIFYSSFTDTSLTDAEEDVFWDDFGESGNGARFRFRIESEYGILRRMRYGSEIDHWSSMIQKIRDFTNNELNAVFWWDSSPTFSCLHLQTFDHERETRLIVNHRWGLSIHDNGEFKYLKINIGDNPTIGVTLKLLEVQSNLDLRVPNDVTLTRK